MKLSDIIPITDQLKQVQGVEGELLRRKRKGTISAIVALAVAILQILIAAIEKDYLKDIEKFFNSLIHFRLGELIGPDGLSIYELTGMLILVIALWTYFLFRWTSFLLKESEEPFRYTFWIKTFKRVEDTPDTPFTLKEGDRFHLLHHDLMERLNERIRRLSLLDVDSLNLPSAAQEALTSHIHIEGHYAIREEKNDDWVIHVMPRIRIGPPSSPAILANPVKYSLKDGMKEWVLNADKYNQIVERVYSSIATEVYRQIESDVKGKISLFPTPYLRAVALFHEAEDFARSNTVDAYDRAIELYRGAMRYFNITKIKWITELLIKCPILWRLKVKFKHMQARVKIGYAKCLIYRRYLSALTGRYRNPLFEIRGELEEVIDSLKGLHKKVTRFKENSRSDHLMAFLTFPKDSLLRYLFLRPSQSLFERQRRLLFDAYVVNALAHYFLDAVEKANEYLGDAKDVDPQQSERNALYLLTAGAIEPDLDEEILLFRQATERAPDFQIAQFFLAYYSEMRFRTQNEIEKARAGNVLEEYDEVLKINPGNTGALANQGYLWWLLKDFVEAKKKFEEGCEIKATVRETFIGELNYGLARIAAEEGMFNKSYDLYTEAISADPGVGAYTASYYDYIVPAMLKRYESFKKNVENKIESLRKSAEDGLMDEKDNEFSQKTINVVFSFVLNDYGNACLNYFLHLWDMDQLKNAIEAYEKAIKIYPQNKIAYYNLHFAYMERYYKSGEEADTEQGMQCLQQAESLAPTWPNAVIALARSRLRYGQTRIGKIMEEAEEENKRAKQAHKGLDEILPPVEEKYSPVVPYGQSKEGMAWSAGDPLNKAKTLYEKAKNQLQEHVNKVLGKEVNKIIGRTKLSSLYEGLNFDVHGKGVNELLLKKPERDRLDENDVEALRVWANALSNNYLCDTAFSAAADLCRYIQEEYYPDNFAVNLILKDMYQRRQSYYWLMAELGEGGTAELQYAEEIKECRKKIKPIIKNWLNQDPIHHAALSWALDYFDSEHRVKFLEVAIQHIEYLNKDKAAELGIKDDDYRRQLKLVLNDEGNDYFAQPDYQKAIEKYKEAIEVDPRDDVIHSNLAGAWEKLKAPGRRVECLSNAISAIQRAHELNPDDSEYVKKLHKLQRKKSIGELFGEKALERWPIVTPIAVEVAGNLIPYVKSETGGPHPTLSDLTVNMREDIFKTNGVKVPGIRFRDNKDLPDGTYSIMINEIPRDKGSISEEKRLFPGTMENLTPLGVFGEETDNPLTGDEAVWILRKDWEKVERAGHRLWEVIEYMVRHLEAVIRRNMGEFFGHQEVMDMCIPLYDIYKQMQDTPADLSALTTVTKGLLNEGVPIIEFKKIVTKFNQLKKEKKNLLTIIETVRSIPEVQKTLPGNNDQYSFYQLGRRFEEEIKQSISIEDYQPVLTMEPENVPDALTAVREQVGSNRNVAILVENAELRPFVRQLIELEFPLVPVLSRRELLPGLEGKIIGEIELEQQDGDLNNNYKRYQKGEEIWKK